MGKRLKDLLQHSSIDNESFLDLFGIGNNVTYTYDNNNMIYTFKGNFGKNFISRGVGVYMNNKKMDKLFRTLKTDMIIIDSMFLLELSILVNMIIENDKIWYKVNKKSLANLLSILRDDTWLRAMNHEDENSEFKIDMNAIKTKMNVQPLPHQLPIYKTYEDSKNKLGYNGILLDADTGTGKAQPLDAKIKTPNGWTTMGELSVGDTITAYDGTDTKVTAIYPQGEKEIYRITFKDGRSTECCEEHLWRVTIDGLDVVTIPTKEIMSLLDKHTISIDLYAGKDTGEIDNGSILNGIITSTYKDIDLTANTISFPIGDLNEEVIKDLAYSLGYTCAVFEGSFIIETNKKFLEMTKIEKVGIKPAQCIAIDHPEHLYVTDDYIVTHNTYMGLSLSIAVDAEVTIIIAMKSIMDTVWTKSLVDDRDPSKYFFNQKITWSTVYTARDLHRPYNNEKYIVLNYEALEKIDVFISDILGKRIAIIGDEIHNFTGLNSRRKDNLIRLCKLTRSENIILMSGTPIKKSPLELIPYLTMIDPKATPTAISRYREIYGSPNEFFKVVVPIRYGSISVKIKKEELKLDPVEYSTVSIKIKNGDKYTLKSIKEDMKKYIDNRVTELNKLEPENKKSFISLLELVLSNNNRLTKSDIDRYKDNHSRLRKAFDNGSLMQNLDLLKLVNEFEKVYIIPFLNGLDKAKFKDVTVALKYPMLKIRGEVLGKVVLRARIDAHAEMAKELDYSIMDGTLGKTLLLSNYIEVCDEAVKKMIMQKYNPVRVYGQYTKNVSATIDKFMNDPKVDSLVGTISSIGTGQPLTAADLTIVFDLPFRTYLFDQLVARTWRLGQTNQVKVAYCSLDTAGEYNINSRNIDILKWAKEAVEEITGNKVYGLDFDKGKTIEMDVVSDIDLETFLEATNEEDLIMKKKFLKDYLDVESVPSNDVDTSMLTPMDIPYNLMNRDIAIEGESFDSLNSAVLSTIKLNRISDINPDLSDDESNVDAELFGFSKKDYFYSKLTTTKLSEFTNVKGPSGWFSVVNSWYRMYKWIHNMTKDDYKDSQAYFSKFKDNITKGMKELPKYRKLNKADRDAFIGDPKEIKEWLSGFDETFKDNKKEIDEEYIERQNAPTKSELLRFNKEQYDVITKLFNDLVKGIVPYSDKLDIFDPKVDKENIDAELFGFGKKKEDPKNKDQVVTRKIIDDSIAPHKDKIAKFMNEFKRIVKSGKANGQELKYFKSSNISSIESQTKENREMYIEVDKPSDVRGWLNISILYIGLTSSFGKDKDDALSDIKNIRKDLLAYGEKIDLDVYRDPTDEWESYLLPIKIVDKSIDAEGILDWFKSKPIPAVEMTAGALGLFRNGVEYTFPLEQIGYLEEEDSEIPLHIDDVEEYTIYLKNIIKYGSSKKYTVFSDGNVFDGKDNITGLKKTEFNDYQDAIKLAKYIGSTSFYKWSNHDKSEMKKSLELLSKNKSTIGKNLFEWMIELLDTGLKTYKEANQKKALNDLKNAVKMAISYIDSNTKVIKNIDSEEYDLTPKVNSMTTSGLELPLAVTESDILPVQTMSHLANVADLEGFDSIKGLVATGANKVSGVLGRVKSLFRASDITHDDISDARFQDIANELVGVPAGLTGKLKDISEYISQYAKHIVTLSTDLDIVITSLSVYLNSESARESVIIDNSVSKSIEANAKDLYNKNNKFITSSRLDVRTIGSLIRNTNEIKAIAKDLKDSTMYLTLGNLQDIQSKISTIDEIIRTIIEERKDFSSVKIKEMSLLIDNLISYTNGVGTLVFLKNSLDVILIDIEAIKNLK